MQVRLPDHSEDEWSEFTSRYGKPRGRPRKPSEGNWGVAMLSWMWAVLLTWHAVKRTLRIAR
jgi:hypothetical protein